MAPVVTAEGCSRRFGGRVVLSDVTFSLEPGTVAALIGANGSGKTTLLRVLAGTLDVDAGSVRVAGGPPGRGAASFVPAGDRMMHWRLTGRSNLEFLAALRGLESRERDDAIVGVAERLGAGSLLDTRVGECSTGQRRRLMVAAGFLAAPPLILLDEAFEDLDEEGKAAVATSVEDHAAAGGVVVLAAPERPIGTVPHTVLPLVGGRIRT
jgi:ABC-2 type transport system ATP-binding protein